MPDDPDILMTLDLTGSHQGVTTITRFWLRSKETADTSNVLAYIATIVEEFEAFIFTAYQNCCSIQWQLLQAQIKVLAGATPYQFIKPYTTRYGSVGGESLPPHDASLVSLYTPFHGRRLHGRLYLPAIAESSQETGYLLDDSLEILATFATLLTSRFGEGGNSPNCWVCVFSRANGVQTNPVPIPHLVYSPLAAIPISRVVARRDIATQRHRKHGRGI